jgi:hypothetical protein
MLLEFLGGDFLYVDEGHSVINCRSKVLLAVSNKYATFRVAPLHANKGVISRRLEW